MNFTWKHECMVCIIPTRSEFFKSLPKMKNIFNSFYRLPIAFAIFSGPDVEWILEGTGSLSSGSARNRVVLSGISSRSNENSSFNSSTRFVINCLKFYVQILKLINYFLKSSSKSMSRNPWSERRIFEGSSNFNREKSNSLTAIGISTISSNVRTHFITIFVILNFQLIIHFLYV